MKFVKLSLLMFFEYAVWGGYLTTLGVYMLNGLHFTSLEVAFVYSFFGLAAIFAMPAAGLIADRLISATYLYAALLALCAACLCLLAVITDKTLFFIVFSVNSFAYMPTLALSNTIAFTALEEPGSRQDGKFIAAKTFGTIGFILAVWLVSFLGFSGTAQQFYIAAGAALITAALSFAQKKVPVMRAKTPRRNSGAPAAKSLAQIFRSAPLLWIFGLSVAIGLLVQVDNIYANKFLSDIHLPYYAFWGSFSQVSGLLIGIGLIFVIARLKIEYCILIGIGAWILRFFTFALARGDFAGLSALVISALSYGVGYKFFTNGAAIFVDKYAPPAVRSTAQSLLLMLYNGIGGALGGFLTSALIAFHGGDKQIPWSFIWHFYGFYAAAILLAAVFCLRLALKKREA